jgi:transposase
MKKYVGIDVGKRSIMVMRIEEGSKTETFSCGTTPAQLEKLMGWISKTDIVVLEAGNLAFRIARMLIAKGCETCVLNPSDLATIYNSLKKTDREDALKLARLAQRIPVNELPTVTIPSEKEEFCRRLVTEQEHWSKTRTKSINRLHSLFVHAGITDVKKSKLRTATNREKAVSLLSEEFLAEARRTLSVIESAEAALSQIGEEMKRLLKEEKEYTTLAMSMPGIGPQAAFTLFAYIGNGSRFSHPSQVSYYAGLVPRVDISGDKIHYGRIIKRGCRQIKRIFLQCSWGLVAAKQGGPLKEFYNRLYPLKGKKKAAVAVARKMLETFYVMLQNGELYRDVPMEVLNRKLKLYGLT